MGRAGTTSDSGALPGGSGAPGAGRATASTPPGVLAGAGAVALGVFAASLGTWGVEGPPDTEVTAQTAQRFFVENADALRLVGFAGALTATLLLMLAALLRRVIRDALPDSALGDVTFGAGVVLAVQWWLLTGVSAVGTATDPERVASQVALGWYGLGTLAEYLGDTAASSRGLFVGAVALAALRARLLPRPLSWVGLGVAVACLLAGLGGLVPWGGFVALWFAGFIGATVWPLLLGVTLLLRARRAPTTT